MVQRYDVSDGQGLVVATIDDAIRLRRVAPVDLNQVCSCTHTVPVAVLRTPLSWHTHTRVVHAESVVPSARATVAYLAEDA